jgi:NADH dehydrogenase
MPDTDRDDHPLVRAEARALDERKPRIVVLGAGFGGIYAAKKLKGADAEVVVVDKRNHHLFQPLLYQVATAGLSPGDIASPIRSILRKQKNARVFLAEALEIDRDAQVVELDTGRLNYDYLVVATGAQTQYFGPDHWEEHSTPLKTIEDAVELRRKILYAFERAEQAEDPEVIEEWLTFVIVGGGPTGVEMAGAIREIAAEVMVQDFRTIRPEEANVVLLDAADHILNTYPESLSEEAKRELEDRDVRVMVDSPVEDIRETWVEVEGERIPTRTVIWAAGVEPVPLLKSLDTEFDDQGRAVVDEDLTLPDDDRVFVIGDAAHFEHYGDDPLPGLAPVAIQQGKATAKNLRKALEGEEMGEFHYWNRGEMATIGRNAAVAVVFDRWEMSGFFAWLAWLFVHVLFLIGFRNKLGVIFDWFYSYLIFKRSARLIVGESPAHQHVLEQEGRAALPEGTEAAPDEPTDDEATPDRDDLDVAE